MVTLKLNLTLIDIIGKKEIKLNLKNSRTLLDILDEISLPPDEIGMVLKNGKWAPLNCTIEQNDEVQLFPHLEGG